MTDRETKGITIYPLLLVNFIGTMGISLVTPFLIFLVERFGGNALIYGVISSMYPVFQLIGSPLLGRWSDTYGRKKVLLLSQIGTLISWMIFFIALFVPIMILVNVDSGIFGSFAMTVPLVLLFIARGFDGLTGGNVSVSNAYIADITEDKDRSKNFGKMSISTNLGFIGGPALAGILSVTIYGEALPVLAAIIISLAGVILIAFYVPESRRSIMKEKISDDFSMTSDMSERCANPAPVQKKGLRYILGLKHIPYMFFIYFLPTLGFNAFYTSFPVYAFNELQWSIAELGLFFSFLSLLLIVVKGPLLSYLSIRYSDPFLIMTGCLILGSNFILLACGSTNLIYVAAVLFAAGNGLMWPSTQSMLSKLAGKDNQGLVFGVFGSILSVASIFGLMSGGFIYELLGRGAFIVIAIIIYLIFPFSLRLRSFDQPDNT
ncbi:MFS transporter [Methanolobus vulcani]|uniref:MFS transporter n=1 Tax=Methanolobus vulcani TaxID=38026 RepID=A0A7Z8KR62_9EURY|nr:MFS transporter [Methanolobus vulcani]TQD29534.1 MFS transporter [Methanolobus vulcani]